MFGFHQHTDIENTPIAFSVVTWPPSKKKIINRFLQITERIPLSHDEVKLAIREGRREKGVRLDPSHGVPLVDTVHYIAKEMHSKSEYPSVLTRKV